MNRTLALVIALACLVSAVTLHQTMPGRGPVSVKMEETE